MLSLTFLRTPHLRHKPDKEQFNKQSKQNRTHTYLKMFVERLLHYVPGNCPSLIFSLARNKADHSPCSLQISLHMASGSSNGVGGARSTSSWYATLVMSEKATLE